MKSNKTIGVILWGIGLLLAHILVFLLPDGKTPALWVTYGFTLFAFFSQLVLWLLMWKKALTPPQQFLHTPILFFSVCYLIGQLLLCAVFALFFGPARTAALINGLFLCAVWALILSAAISRNHAEDVDQRQKNHHIKL